VRKEIRECPKKPWFDLFVERSNNIEKNGPGVFGKQFNEFLGDLASS
jgi:hypothetical protein